MLIRQSPEKMDEKNEQNAEAWGSFPVTTEVPPGYDGTTNWLKYSDAVQEWCDLTKLEAKRQGTAIAARLSDGLSVFLYRFFQMLRCNRGQTDFQRWMVRYEIARKKRQLMPGWILSRQGQILPELQ